MSDWREKKFCLLWGYLNNSLNVEQDFSQKKEKKKGLRKFKLCGLF